MKFLLYYFKKLRNNVFEFEHFVYPDGADTIPCPSNIFSLLTFIVAIDFFSRPMLKMHCKFVKFMSKIINIIPCMEIT